jgi:hypothetical protein
MDLRDRDLWPALRSGTELAKAPAPTFIAKEVPKMDLWIWLPAMAVLGLVTLGLIFAFVVACDKV